MNQPAYLPTTRYEFPELIDNLGLKIGVEIGVEFGPFSYYLLKHSGLTKLYSIDPWARRPGWKKHAESLLTHMGDRSEIIHDYSTNAVKLFTNNSIDFIYIDGAHHYEAVLEDSETWYPIVRPGGVIAGHDYDANQRHKSSKNGVVFAVTDFLKTHPHQLHLTSDITSSWWFIKEDNHEL